MKTQLFIALALMAMLHTACSTRENMQTSGKMQPDSLQQAALQDSLQLQQQQNVVSGYSNRTNTEPSGNELEEIDPAKVARASGEGGKSVIQVAILLDTSNSMDGLIDQARAQLWKMVGDLALARDMMGNTPDIEIALYEYGNDRLSQASGYLRRVVPFTTDLDLISERLFLLTTYGGSEYCGKVIQSAVRNLDWHKDNMMLKLIFIAGNEEYTQGSVHYMEACKEAIAKGININTIFCGSDKEGIATKWKDGADCADGKYMSINQNQAIAYIDAPQDAEILTLNRQLNDTYLGYGESGKKRKAMQEAEDMNASKYGSANAAQRAATKASSSYKTDSWDMVDAQKAGKLNMESIPEEDLPDELKNLTPQQRKAYLDQKAEERKQIQAKINQLEAERRAYIANERSKKSADSKDNTLDNAIMETLKYQGQKKKYQFEK